jgi:hypothetical protein
MPIITVCSAKGSPGVSTFAIALAAVWPQDSLLADLDPAGSDLMWRYRAQGGEPLDTGRGLLSLGVAVRPGGSSAGALDLRDHVQELQGGQWALVGVRSPEQVTGLGPVWPQISAALVAAPTVVVADVGRVVPGSPAMPVLERSRLVLFLTRATVEAYAHLRERLASLAEPLGLQGSSPRRVGVLIVGSDRDSHAVHDLQKILDIDGSGAHVLGRIADDGKGADALNGLRTGGAGRSLLVRSVRGLVPTLAERLGAETAA